MRNQLFTTVAISVLELAGCTTGGADRTAVAALAGSAPIIGLAGKCVDVDHARTDDGTKIQLWDCDGTDAQAWAQRDGTLVTVGDKCLDVSGGDTANGTRVQLWQCNGTAAQQWHFEGSQLVGIGGKCLDVAGADPTSGTPLTIWDCHGGENQRWSYDGGGGGGGGDGGGTGGGAGSVFEGFDDGFGLLAHVWSAGETQPYVADGILHVDGTRGGAGAIMWPGDAATGFANGLFEIRAILDGDTVGDNSGPANVLWPGSDQWPGPEIDIGEIDGNGRVYMATHWRDEDGNNQFTLYYTPEGFDQRQWHTYAAFLRSDRIIYSVDGQVIGVETEHPAPDFEHGGENHLIGVMNRSSQTRMLTDWVRWTPEASVQ